MKLEDEYRRKDSNIPCRVEYLRGAIIASCARSDANNPYYCESAPACLATYQLHYSSPNGNLTSLIGR